MVNTISSNILPIKTRKKKAQLVTFIVGLLFILIGTYYTEATNRFYALSLSTSFYMLILSVYEIVQRICLLTEEIHHIPSRYDNIIQLCLRTFQFSIEFVLVFILSISIVGLCGVFYGNPIKLLHELGWSAVFNLFGVLLWTALLRMKYGPLYQALSIGNMNGLDFGSAMAYSIYHGYLNIILPNKGDDHKGFKELVQDYEAKEQITFISQKLIELIPLSLYCPPMISQNSKIMEPARSLPKLEINRAGVKKRSYHCTAYKINDKKTSQKLYVCCEYATPLYTLYNIINHNNEHANDYATQRKELALQFYLTLQKILNNDPDCKDCCDLIFFDDKNGEEFVDVGEVILEHLNNSAKKTV